MRLLFSLSMAAAILLQTSPAFAETRCGWFENPTPANAWLWDKDGQWVISTQGVGEDENAAGDWPDFKDEDWVITNAGSYGYGCACMKVTTDLKTHYIVKIYSARSKKLALCRVDKALTEPENPLAE